MLRTAKLLPQQGFRRWASTRPVSRPNRQPATEPPGSYSDGTHTRWRRRAYVGSATQTAPPTLGARTIRAKDSGSEVRARISGVDTLAPARKAGAHSAPARTTASRPLRAPEAA